MAFIPRQYDDGKVQYKEAATGQTIVKGDALIEGAAGYLTVSAGAADGTPVFYVAMETVTTTANGQRVLAIRTDGVIFDADADGEVSLTDIGTDVDLASKSTINPDASVDPVFHIESVVGAQGTATVARGWFTNYTPVADA